MRKIKIISKVEDGKLVLNREQIGTAIASFEGKRIYVTIEQEKEKRTNSQNAYWWAVVVPIFQQGLHDAGMTRTKEQTHELIGDLIKQRYGYSPLEKEFQVNDQVYVEKRRTSELTKKEFMELVAYAKEFGREVFRITVPDPSVIGEVGY